MYFFKLLKLVFQAIVHVLPEHQLVRVEEQADGPFDEVVENDDGVNDEDSNDEDHPSDPVV